MSYRDPAVYRILHPEGMPGSCAGRPYQYNLLYGVNHPGFILQYGMQAVPLLSKVPPQEYPAEYMLPAAQDYLYHHQVLLRLAGCSQDAATICSLC